MNPVILKSPEQIGDAKALLFVQKLANGGGIATADCRVESAMSPNRVSEWSDTSEARRQLTHLLLRLGGTDNAVRWMAQTELRQSAPVPVELLLPPLIRLARVRRQSPFLFGTGLFAAGMLLLGLLLVFDAWLGRVSHLPVLAAGLIVILLMLRRWLLLRGAATRALANFNDVRVTGPLLKTLDHPNREARLVTRELLLHLLPRFRAVHAGLLDAADQARLLGLLIGEDASLTIAALQALAQLDIEDALPLVRELAAGKGPAAIDPQVREAAQTYWAEIRARSARQRVSRNLLRVIDSNQPDIDMAQSTSHVESS